MYNLETIIEENIANSISNLADRYRERGKLKIAKKLYLKVLKLRKSLSIIDKKYYQPLIAETLSSLASISSEENRYSLAIEYYLASISIDEELYNRTYILKYIYLLAQNYTNIAHLYRRESNYDRAEFFYNKALLTYSKLPLKEYNSIQMSRLNIYNHLSIICNAEDKFKETKDAYIKALEIYRVLVNENSDRYRDELATLLFDLASLYFRYKQQNRAGEIYIWTLEILLSLAQKDSKRYRDMLAITFYNLAQIYNSQLDYSNAISAYRESLKYYIILVEENPSRYGSYIALLFSSLASFYKKQNKMELAEYFYLKMVDTYSNLALYNESLYGLKLASSIIDGVVNYHQHSLSLYQAEAILKDYDRDKEEVSRLLDKIYTLREEKIYVY